VESSGHQLLGTVFVGSHDGRSYRSVYEHYYDEQDMS
jgi:hypothetical protein